MLVSSVAGALLIIPVFYLAKAIYSETAAWIVSILVTFSPLLMRWSGAILTESLFITLFISGITLGWYAIQYDKKLFFFLSGAFIGLSYMTRIIGLVAVPVVVLWTIFYSIFPDKSGNYNLRKGFKTVISFLVLFTLGFFIVTGAYLVHMRTVFGHWDITASYSSVRDVLEFKGYESLADKDKQKKDLSSEGVYTKFHKKITGNLIDYSSGIITIFSFVIIFVIAGLFNNKWKILYLVSAIAVYFAALLVQPLNPAPTERIRYLSPIVPLFLVLASGGILHVQNWVKQWIAKKAIVPVLIGIILISFILQHKLYPVHFYKLQSKAQSVNFRKEVGIWMKKNLPHPIKVMSRKPFIAYYADAKLFRTPSTYEGVINLANSKGVDYIVVERAVDFHLRPELRFLFDTAKVPADLELMVGIRNPGTTELQIGVYKINRSLSE